MTRPARSPWSGRARRLGVAFAALLVLGIAGEVLLRLDPGAGGSQNLIRMQTEESLEYYTPDPELGALLEPSRRDVIETLDYTYTFQTDHAGFPNPEPWPSRVDVAVLGNSLLDGRGVGMGGQFTTLLEQRLGDRTVENFALPGAGSGHEYRIYRRYALPLEPKLVVVVLWPVWDIDNSLEFDHWLRENRPDPDYTHYRFEFSETHPSGPPVIPSMMARVAGFVRDQLAKSYLLRASYRRVRALFGRQNMRELVSFPNGDEIFLSTRDQKRLAEGIDRPGTPDIREIFFKPLEQLRTEVEAHGARFLVVLVPSKEEIYGAEAFPDILRLIGEVRSGLESRQLPVLDLYPVFRDLGQEQPPFYRADMHLNPFGNQIVADAIAKWIEDERIFTAPAPSASAAH
jgi:SGNH hydrolase-like domain, acetyltransferase AlgX